MALQPKYSGHILGSQNAPFTIEAYLDYTCPFSWRAYKRLVEEVMPFAEEKFPGKVKFIFRHQIQPWHPQSTCLHEAALAVESLDASKFFAFSTILFENSKDFYDANVRNLSLQDIYSKLAELAAKLNCASVTPAAVSNLLALNQPARADELNYGNAVTNSLKYHIKIARQNAIHVSPTYLFDGLIDSSVQSAYDLQQWKQLLSEKFGLN